MNRMPIEFELHLNADQHQFGKTDEPDFLDAFLADAQLAGSIGRNGNKIVELFRQEASGIDAQHSDIYKKIAARASTATETPLQKNGNEWDEEIGGARLTKRNGNITAGARAWLTKVVERGESAVAAIDAWVVQFPHRSPEIEKELRAIAAEL